MPEPEASFCLKPGESLPQGFHRILAEQLNAAAALLSEPDGSLDKAVHESRKCLKRARSVLRLIRPAVPDAYSRENQRLGDIGRQLSALRDAQALIQTVEDLGKDVKRDRGSSATLELLRSRKKEVLDALKSGGELESSVYQLRAAVKDIGKLSLRKVDLPVIVESVRTSVKRGRRAFAKAYSDPQAENFHECRKRAKDMRYQTEVLTEFWPEVLEGYSDSAKELEQLLGEDHNLAVLAEILEGQAPVSGKRPELQREIRKKQDKLRAKARQLGARLYSEPAKAWTRRLESSWEVWRAMSPSQR